MTTTQSTRGARKVSSVSFDGAATKLAVTELKRGRQLVTAKPTRLISSANSGISTASTWTFTTRPASSFHALRSRILITIEKAITLLTEYQTRHLTNADDDFHGVYQEFVKQLLARIGYKNDLINADHLESVIIKKFQSDSSVARRADFKSLVVVCSRAKAFKELKSQVQSRIDEVYTYADIFCVTFSNECEGYSFECIENYENTKTECLKEIIVSLDSVQVSSDELKDIQPLSTYLESYSRVLHYIEHVVHCLSCAAVNLKRWIIADEQYEKTLEREISYLKQRSSQLTNDRLTVSSLRYESKARIPNETGKIRKVELTLSKYRSLVERLKEQNKLLSRSLTDAKENQRMARRHLATVEKQATRRLKPTEMAELKSVEDRLREKTSQLQAKEDKLQLKLNEVNTKLTDANKEILSLEQESSRQKKFASQTCDQVREQKSALKAQTDACTSINHKMRVLQKIKSLKQDRETLRKMEFNIINLDYKEAMQNAIRDVAFKVGTHWPTIYVKLPFLPTRSADKLASDIKAIQSTGALLDRSAQEMAVMAFEKWAKRSAAASINELIFTAKTVTEATTKRELSRKAKYSVPRLRHRFDQQRIKSHVIYV